MAVIPGIKGVEVTINVGGQTAREYAPPELERAPVDLEFDMRGRSPSDDVPYWVCYILAEPGAAFDFHARKTAAFQYLGGHQIGMMFDVDGRRVPGIKVETHHADTRHQRHSTTFKQDGFLEGNDVVGWVKRPFRFSDLNIVEDGVSAKEIKEQILQAKNLGSLRASLYYLGPLVHTTPKDPKPSVSDPALNATSSLSEKALKGRAIGCRVGLGEAVPDRGLSRTKTVNHEDPKTRPFAVIDFRYRSLEGLYQEGIIPRPQLTVDPSPADEADVVRVKPETRRGAKREDAIDVDELPDVKPEPSRGVKRERSGTVEAVAASQTRFKERKLRNGCIQLELDSD